ncbi:MAG: extracellular solute-binding protein [Bifidobacteriaceae bacterium]|nr:extracellular solute-binding protein [Bifidobacteriaceae bacterium]
MIKKVFGAALCAALLFGSAACGESGASSDSIQLTVWSSSEDQATSDSWLPVMEKAFEKAHPEYKITWKNSVVAEADASKTVKQDPSAAADVYMFANDQLGSLVSSDAIGELSDEATKQLKEQNDESMIESITGTDGKYYGMPFSGNTWFMYYNKSKFSDEDVKSLDTMLEKGKVAFSISNAWYLPAFYVGAGATIFGENGLDAKSGVKLGDNATAVTKYLANMVNNSNFVLDDNGSGLAGLQNGTVDAYFSGTWEANDAKKALGDNYGAAQLPTFTTDAGTFQMKAFSGSKAIAYNPTSKNAEVASKVAAFLASTEAQKKHYELRATVPTDRSLADLVKNDPAAKAQMDTIANTSILQSTLTQMNDFWDPTQTFGAELANKEINADNAAAKTEAFAKQLAGIK